MMGNRVTVVKLEAGLHKLEKVLIIITWVVFALLTLMIVVDVFSRNAFNAPIPASAEATELFMPYIVFLPLAYTLITGQHVRVSIVMERLPSSARRYCEIFANLIGFSFFVMLTWWSSMHFWESFIVREEMLAIIKLPWWVGKFALPVGAFVIAVEFLAELVMAFIKPADR